MGKRQKLAHIEQVNFETQAYRQGARGLQRQENLYQDMYHQRSPEGYGFGQIGPDAFDVDTRHLDKYGVKMADLGAAASNTKMGRTADQLGLANRLSELQGAAVTGMRNTQDAYTNPQQTAMNALIARGQAGSPQMQSFAQALAQRAGQQMPSMAEAQMRQNIDKSIAAQMAGAASAQGVSPGAALRNASQQAGALQQQGAADVAALRVQEQQQQRAQQLAEYQAAAGITGADQQMSTAALGAGAGIGAGLQGQQTTQQQAYANALQGMRGQDIQLAGQQQQFGLAQEQALAQSGINAAVAGGQLYQGAAGAAGQRAQMQYSANVAHEQAQQNYYNRLLGIQQQQIGGAQSYGTGIQPGGWWGQYGMPLIGAGLQAGGAGAAAMLSDERAKEDIKPAARDIRDFLSKLNAAKYRYKEDLADDPAAGEGEHYSVMAQDLARSKLGSQMVEQRPDGYLQVNYAKGFAAMLAAQSDIHKRLKKIENKAA